MGKLLSYIARKTRKQFAISEFLENWLSEKFGERVIDDEGVVKANGLFCICSTMSISN